MKKIFKKADEEPVAAFIVYGSLAKTDGSGTILWTVAVDPEA